MAFAQLMRLRTVLNPGGVVVSVAREFIPGRAAAAPRDARITSAPPIMAE
jgi:hypothetical protein